MDKRSEWIPHQRTVSVPMKDVCLEGDLTVPKDAIGILIFADGGISSRHSVIDQYVSQAFNKAGLATFILDLLTEEEADLAHPAQHLRFDVTLLTERLVRVTEWVKQNSEVSQLPIGYFGSGTGVAAALFASALLPEEIKAVVGRSGRPDLAASVLSRTRVPVLLIVGSRDYPLIRLNQEAAARLHAPKELIVVPGATHLFEESGALDKVIQVAVEWFRIHLVPRVGYPAGDGYV